MCLNRIVRSVREKEYLYKSRAYLKPEWGGLCGKELCEVSRIPGCIFVHSELFFGSNSSYKGALEMALKSLP